MCGGGGSIVDTITNPIGDVIDTVTDVGKEAGNFVGDVVTNPIVDTAAAIALGQPELLGLDAAATDAALGSSLVDAGTAGSIGAYPGLDILNTVQNAVSGYNNYNNLSNFLSSDNTDTNVPNDYSQTGYENIPTAPDTSGSNTGEEGNQTGSTGTYDPNTGIFNPSGSTNIGEEGNQTGSTGTYDPNTGIFTPTDKPYDGPSSSTLGDSSTNWLDTLGKSAGVVGDAVKKYLNGLTPSDYLKGAGILGMAGLAGANQSDLNQTIMNWYNAHNAAQAGKLADYQAGRTPKLNLGTVTPRTAQNVVVMPGKKNGGVLHSKHSKEMHDLMNEYESLKSRRHYAKGNIVAPFKMVNPFRGIPINIRNPMYLTPMERRNEEIKSMGSIRKGFAYGTPQSGITSTNTANDKRIALINMLKSNPELLKRMMQARAAANQPQMQQNMQSQMQPEAGDGIASALGFRRGGKIHEIDYRDKGGYVPPIGKKERADDIPAMLSNNEFVFTANAVRNAGKGDVKKGAKKMYALMKHLEKKGAA